MKWTRVKEEGHFPYYESGEWSIVFVTQNRWAVCYEGEQSPKFELAPLNEQKRAVAAAELVWSASPDNPDNWPKAEKPELGFHIEYRVGLPILVWHTRGCRPAEETEVKLWVALKGEIPCTDETSRLLKAKGELR